MTIFILFYITAVLTAVFVFAAFQEIENDHAEERYYQKKTVNRRMFEEIKRLQKENFLLAVREGRH